MNAYSKIQYMYDAALTGSGWAGTLDHVAEALGSKGVLLFSDKTVGTPFSSNQSNSFYIGKDAIIEDYYAKHGHHERKADYFPTIDFEISSLASSASPQWSI